MGFGAYLAQFARIILGIAFIGISIVKMTMMLDDYIDPTAKLFKNSFGIESNFLVANFIRLSCVIQTLAGVLILINQCKLGAFVLAASLIPFLAGAYNPYIIGFDYQSMTLFANEFALFGLCIILYALQDNVEKDALREALAKSEKEKKNN